MAVRPVRLPEDLLGLDQLFERCIAHDGHHPFSEHKYRSLRSGRRTGEGFVLESDGAAIAYLHLLASRVTGTFEIEIAVDPAHREGGHEDLLRAALARVRQLGGETVFVWVYTQGGERPLQEIGFEHERDLHQLRMRLPARVPGEIPGIAVRGFDQEDEDALLYLNNRAFAGHPEAGNWSAADFHEHQAYEWYDAQGVRMAWAGDRLAGFCWTKAHPGRLGEIYLIATDPDCRGRGVGRLLALEGLQFLSDEMQSTVGMLYVDAANQTALRMYEGLGFEIHHTDRAFRLRV